MGGLQAGALASVAATGAPFAVAIGRLAVAAFAIGPALLNSKIRNLGTQLQQVDATAATGDQTRSPNQSPSPSNADN